MLPVLHVGPLAIQTPLLFLLLGFWLATIVAEREANRIGLNNERLNSLITWALFGGILGGRLVYVIRFFPAFREDWWGIVSLNPSTIDRLGGILIALLIAFGYGWWHRLPLGSSLDAVTPAFGVLGIALASSFLASGAYYGMPTTLPWGIDLWGAVRHPTQIYLLIATGLVFFTVWWGRASFTAPGSGVILWLFLMAMVLFILEGFRGDSTLIYNGIRGWQIVYLIVGLTLMIFLRFKWSTKK